MTTQQRRQALKEKQARVSYLAIMITRYPGIVANADDRALIWEALQHYYLFLRGEL